jgi:hypothetical protein
MDFAEQERRPEQIVGSEEQTVPLGGSNEISMPPVHVGDYYKLPKALQRSHFFEDQPAPSQEKTQGKSNAVVPEQAQRSESKQTVAPTYQSFAPKGSDETSMLPVYMGDYNKLPKALQRSHFFEDQPAPSQEKTQGSSKGASAPMRIAQADMGMSDDFWWKALASAGLAIWKGGEYIITGSEKAVEALYRNLMKSHQGSGEEKEKEAEKGKISGTSDHAKERKDQAAAGDKSREVGDANRVVREGKRLTDSESGHDVYVNGDRVVIVDSKTGKQITQFKNTKKNTQQRIRSGRWIPH